MTVRLGFELGQKIGFGYGDPRLQAFGGAIAAANTADPVRVVALAVRLGVDAIQLPGDVLDAESDPATGLCESFLGCVAHGDYLSPSVMMMREV